MLTTTSIFKSLLLMFPKFIYMHLLVYFIFLNIFYVKVFLCLFPLFVCTFILMILTLATNLSLLCFTICHWHLTLVFACFGVILGNFLIFWYCEMIDSWYLITIIFFVFFFLEFMDKTFFHPYSSKYVRFCKIFVSYILCIYSYVEWFE